MQYSRMRRIVLAAVVLAFIATSTSWAQTSAPASVPATEPASQPAPVASTQPAKVPTDPIEDLINKSKVIIPEVWTWGADARLRHETFINAAQLSRQAANNEEEFQRYRGRWWSTITPAKNMEFYTRFTWEGRSYCEPENPSAVGHRGWMDERDQVMIDNLYFKLSEIGGTPFTIQAGRMDINLGDRYLVAEGTPLDGSRTFYFDAVRILTDLKDIKTTIDTYYISIDAQGDDWFPKLKEEPIPSLMTEQDEQGAIVYVTNQSIPHTSIEPYFIYKNSKHETLTQNYTWTRSGDDADIYTFGLRLAGDVGKHWNYSLNQAGQFGHKNDRRLCAFASINRLAYLLRDKWQNEFYVDYEYLSGDRKGTRGTDENFDILWGRWQIWDELYGFAYIPETRYYQYSNLHRVGPGWRALPTKAMEIGLRYDLMFADTNYLKNTGNFAGGCFRGQMIVPYFKYTFTKYLFTRVMPAFFFPGDYYNQGHNDPSTFLRFEVVFTW